MSPALDERNEDASGSSRVSSSSRLSRPKSTEKLASAEMLSPSLTNPSFQPAIKRTATSAPTSSNPSPKPSRDSSPIRPLAVTASQNASIPVKSRKGGQEVSPQRMSKPTANQPPQDGNPAAPAPRSLSATPRLPPSANSDTASDPQKPVRHSRSPVSKGQSSASASSRVKSPPSAPSSGRAGYQTKRGETDATPSSSASATPKIVVDDSTGNSAAAKSFESIAEEEDDDDHIAAGMRSPVSIKPTGILEVVHESSLPETPAIGNGLPMASGKGRSTRSLGGETRGKESSMQPPSTVQTESGSESGGTKSSVSIRKDSLKQQPKPTTVAKPPVLRSTGSLTQLTSAKGKQGGDGSMRNMTVETETVTSIPVTPVGGAPQRDTSGRTEGGNSLRLKPSSETIRPKKEKKKPVRKTPVVNPGTASSKADIFERKVADAVDEADSSDSAETFVYESNPPEPFSQRRSHSRTPSVTSATSQLEPFGGRYRPDAPHKKRSMKFSNNPHHFSGHQGDGENVLPGAAGSKRISGSNSGLYHHIGRHGRNPGHVSLFDSDSPFTTDSKSGPNTRLTRNAPRASSPRSGFPTRVPGSLKSHRSTYDLEGDAADDERTPLINSSRNPRNRHSRRPGNYYDHYTSVRPKRFLGSVLCWFLLGLLVTLLVAAIVVALVLCSKTLINVKVRDIGNVIASEEEIVFDFHVHALNPNIVAVQVNNIDMKVFARSRYVGSSMSLGPIQRLETTHEEHENWHAASDHSPDVHGWDGVDEGTDPIEPGGDTMLLGRVKHLDSPLTFEASPLRYQIGSDSASVSLSYPGNTTADKGSNRWKTVVQHSFELIVVGQLKYTLPISSREHSVSFGQGKTTVDPDQPVKEKTLKVTFTS